MTKLRFIDKLNLYGTPLLCLLFNKLNLFILVINQPDAQTFVLQYILLHASTCFEHHVLIIRRSKFYYTASGIITPVGGRPKGRPPTGVMIPEAV